MIHTTMHYFHIPGTFDIKWKVDEDNEEILLFLSSTSADLVSSGKGYLAFGMSEVGGMLGADIVSVEFSGS